MLEERGEGQIRFKDPRPNDEGDEYFRATGRAIIPAETDFFHDKEHDRHPEWDANHVVQVALGKPIGEIRLEHPTVDEIEGYTENEQRIFEVTEAHGLMATGHVEGADDASDEDRPGSGVRKFYGQNDQPPTAQVWQPNGQAREQAGETPANQATHDHPRQMHFEKKLSKRRDGRW